MLEEESEGFDQVRAGFLDRRPLAGDIQFGAEGHKPVVFALDNRC